ncbi:MAG TPA: RDD family protein [Woeseiaceae bacterium]|nr:RDD family protein [Woeseiaceae bacterium]
MENASLGRRLGAILYDGLLLFALLCAGTVPFVLLSGGEVEPGTLVHQLTLLAISWGFFAGFWSRYGRTLGLQSWRLRIETFDGHRPSLLRSTVRFFAAILSWLPAGLGFWWQLWDPERLAWHDRLSGTRLRRVADERTARATAHPPESA